MVWLSVILGLMSSGLLPRVCAFGVPGQSKTHGNSGFENDVEDLVTDLPAAFVANDVPAAFYAPAVFVYAAMVASGSWFSMLGAALSAFDDAAMLCVHESLLNHVVDGSDEERSVIVRSRLTFRVSGRVRRAGKNGCGL